VAVAGAVYVLNPDTKAIKARLNEQSNKPENSQEQTIVSHQSQCGVTNVNTINKQCPNSQLVYQGAVDLPCEKKASHLILSFIACIALFSTFQTEVALPRLLLTLCLTSSSSLSSLIPNP
jgi:hypothetical protein